VLCGRRGAYGKRRVHLIRKEGTFLVCGGHEGVKRGTTYYNNRCGEFKGVKPFIQDLLAATAWNPTATHNNTCTIFPDL
jgi:hypothetical protein